MAAVCPGTNCAIRVVAERFGIQVRSWVLVNGERVCVCENWAVRSNLARNKAAILCFFQLPAPIVLKKAISPLRLELRLHTVLFWTL